MVLPPASVTCLRRSSQIFLPASRGRQRHSWDSLRIRSRNARCECQAATSTHSLLSCLAPGCSWRRTQPSSLFLAEDPRLTEEKGSFLTPFLPSGCFLPRKPAHSSITISRRARDRIPASHISGKSHRRQLSTGILRSTIPVASDGPTPARSSARRYLHSIWSASSAACGFRVRGLEVCGDEQSGTGLVEHELELTQTAADPTGPRSNGWEPQPSDSLWMSRKNARHCSLLTSSTPPCRLRESLTSTDEHQAATSTQFPESALELLVRQRAAAYQSRLTAIKHPFDRQAP